MKKNIIIIIICIVLAGGGYLTYPHIREWWYSLRETYRLNEYLTSLRDMRETDYDSLFERAEAYNANIAKKGMNRKLTNSEMDAYEAELNVEKTGIMGYIIIPKLELTMPIYHGTDERVLQTSVGHIEGTSLPVGGGSTHCVLTGHRGIPSAKLLTGIDQLSEGDIWTINVLDKTLTYEVDQIKTVEPAELADIAIEQDKDYCTLVTGTPFGVNSKRLLVRGHRIQNVQGDARFTVDALRIRPSFIEPFVIVAALVLLLVIMFLPIWKIEDRD